jgi:glutathione synthase/RimK-type ligase-like ATP-grasp enzyme
MANNSPIHIGPTTFISFPKLGFKKVPAKVDTGADSSSIWASDIKQVDGKLSFKLFAPASKFYTGKTIITRDYQVISVKNSFGRSEFRYKVKLVATVENRTLKMRFTLSNRSENRYPILIGRRTLRGRFLVDVSKGLKHKKSWHILILASKPGKTLDAFVDDVQRHIKTKNVNFTIRRYKDIAFLIDNKKLKVYDTTNNKDLDKYDIVYFKGHKKHRIIASAIAQYLRHKHIVFFDKEILEDVSYDKLSEYVRLALHGLLVPLTLCGAKSFLKDNHQIVTDKTGWPVVVKEIDQDSGRKNYLVHSAKELKHILDTAEETDKFVIQAFVPNKGYLRVYVMGNDATLGIYRIRHQHANPMKQHLNNPAGSVNASLVEVDSMLSEMALKAAKLMQRQIAGVDLIKHQQTGKWYVLEVNSAPQLRTGSFIAEKTEAFAAFVDNIIGR